VSSLLNLITGRVTNPGAALTALTPNIGDSFVVKNFDTTSAKARLESMWAFGATAGVVRVFSPLMHDDAQGIRLRWTAADPSELLPDEVEQVLYAQDQLNVQMSGGAAEVDTLAMLVLYDDIAGAQSQRLYTYDQIKPRIQHFLGIECNLTTGGVAGQYGGAQAINQNFDVLKANTDYAILGYTADNNALAVGITGPDTSNFRVGGPVSTRHEITAGWFIDLAKRSGRAAIPVFNSANKANTIVDIVDTAVAAARNISFICAQLASA